MLAMRKRLRLEKNSRAAAQRIAKPLPQRKPIPSHPTMNGAMPAAVQSLESVAQLRLHSSVVAALLPEASVRWSLRRANSCHRARLRARDDTTGTPPDAPQA